VAYTGDVDAYGPADFRHLPELMIAKIGVGPVQANAYLLRCLRTQDQLLIDAGDDALFIMTIAGTRSLSTIVTTHAHPGHFGALHEIADGTSAVTVAHPADVPDIPVPTSRPVGNGDAIHVGSVPLTVLHLGGHTPGSIGLLYAPPQGAPHLFSGDALLRGGPGTTGTADEQNALVAALRREVFGPLPDDTWVYPGHGHDTTVGQERASV
jgi:glyoxylase-like metal-dependent hydrolase (beta-lactamase superfamily II)